MTKQSAAAFGDRLSALFTAAGSPTLAAVCAGVNRGRTTRLVTPQRLSDWRRGRHLPRDFATVEPVLVWLLSRAQPQDVHGPGVVKDWEDLWDAVTAESGDATVRAADTIVAGNPFVGLAHYTEDDADRFFGRDDVVADMITTIRAAETDRGAGRTGIVVVTGVSGAGKSSVLAAGLARASASVAVCARIRSGAVHDLPTPEVEPPRSGTGPIPVVCVDQFEEIVALSDDERRAVVDRVVSLSRQVVVVLAVRADVFGLTVAFPDLARAWQHRSVIVGEMSESQLRDVIVQSARAVGVGVESGLPDVVIADVHAVIDADGNTRAGRLPLLSHVLRATWNRRVGGRLTVAAYQATGGVASAVADTAEQAWATVEPDNRDLARRVLMSLVFLAPDGLCLRSPSDRAMLRDRFDEPAIGIVETFAAARIITIDGDRIEFIHDTVVTAWPRLRRWITEHGRAQSIRQRVEESARDWAESGRDRAFLYPGARLEADRREVGDLTVGLSKTGLDFLRMSARARRRRRRLVAGAAAMLVVLALVSAVTASVVVVQKRSLARQRDETAYRTLLAVTDNLTASDPVLAQQLLLAAHRTRPDDPAVRAQVLATQDEAVPQTLAGHVGPVYGLSFDPSGRLLASAADDGTVRLWTTTPGREAAPVGQLDLGDGYRTSVVFSPTRPIVASAGRDGSVVLADTSDPRRPHVIATMPPVGNGPVYTLSFSPDGSTLAAPGDDGRVALWDVTDPAHPHVRSVLVGHVGAARATAFSPDGATVATGGDDRTVRLWDVASGQPLGAPMTGFPSRTHAVTFSPTRPVLAVATDTAVTMFVDISDRTRPHALGEPLLPGGGGAWAVAFDPRRDRIAAAGGDGNVPMWNVLDTAHPLSMAPLRTGSSGSDKAYSIAFAPDGDRIASGGADGRIRVWQLPGDDHIAHAGAIQATDMSGDGHAVATFGADGRLRAWAVDGADVRTVASADAGPAGGEYADVAVNTDGRQVALASDVRDGVSVWSSTAGTLTPTAVIPTRARYTRKVAFAASRDLLAVGADDQDAAVWDTSDPVRPHQIGPDHPVTDTISDLAVDPSGRWLAVSSEDLRVRVFDLHSESDTPTADVGVGPSSAQGLAFADGGRVLVAADGGVGAWSLDAQGHLSAEDVAGRSGVNAVTATAAPGDPRVMIGATNGLQVLDLQDPARPRLVEGSIVPQTTGAGATQRANGWRAAPLPGGMAIASGGDDDDGSLHVLGSDIESTITRLCTTVGATPMPRSTWDRLVGNEPMVDGCRR